MRKIDSHVITAALSILAVLIILAAFKVGESRIAEIVQTIRYAFY